MAVQESIEMHITESREIIFPAQDIDQDKPIPAICKVCNFYVIRVQLMQLTPAEKS